MNIFLTQTHSFTLEGLC